MTCFFLEILIFFLINSIVDIYYLEFISQNIKEILYVNTNSKAKTIMKHKEIFILSCF